MVTAVVVVGVSPRTLAGHQACSDQEDYYQLSSRDVCPARATAADQAGTPAHPKAFWRHSSCTQWPACAVATAWGPFLLSALSLACAASLHIPILRSVPCWQVPAVALKSVTASVAEALAQASEEPVAQASSSSVVLVLAPALAAEPLQQYPQAEAEDEASTFRVHQHRV